MAATGTFEYPQEKFQKWQYSEVIVIIIIIFLFILPLMAYWLVIESQAGPLLLETPCLSQNVCQSQQHNSLDDFSAVVHSKHFQARSGIPN